MIFLMQNVLSRDLMGVVDTTKGKPASQLQDLQRNVPNVPNGLFPFPYFLVFL